MHGVFRDRLCIDEKAEVLLGLLVEDCLSAVNNQFGMVRRLVFNSLVKNLSCVVVLQLHASFT